MSANVIDKLHREHANMRRILILVRLQLDLLERQGMPDFVLLTNALYYMRKFPSIVHHPKEDLIFGKLLAADASVKQEVDRMRRQHEEIYVLEDRLINLVLEVQAGKRELCSRLLELGRLYLKTQAEHVETEERVLFPRALRVLKQKDWKEVRTRSSSIEDPLFGNQVTERYRYLYDYLLHEAADQGLSLSGTSQDPESSSAKINFSR
ncbi:MAG: hemerythrin domain-containing protein [Gammaproteobacteria bacterium]